MRVQDLEPRELLPGTTARMVHGERMTIAHWHFDPGVLLPEHSHPHEQITTIVSGQFELTMDGETVSLADGGYVVIPPNTVHSGRSVTECRIIDVFSPVREDFR